MIRLHHMQAKKYFLAGRTVALCPCKLRPGKPWHPECWVNLDMDEGRHEPEQAWVLIKNQFRFYNCTCYETGYNISYWIEEEEVSHC